MWEYYFVKYLILIKLGGLVLNPKMNVRKKYVPLTIFSLLGALALSWVFASNFFEIMTMDYDAPDLVGTKSEIRTNFLGQISTWEIFVDSSMFYLINFIPVFFVLVSLGLYAEKRSIYTMGRHKFKSFKKKIYKDVFEYIVLSTLTVTFTFALYFSVGSLFVYRSLEDIGGFASVLPNGFYSNHPYLFFMFMIFTIYLGLAFTFNLIAVALVLLLDQEYKVIIGVLAIYFIYGKIGAMSGLVWFDVFTSFTAFNTLYSTFETFLPLLGLLIIGLLLLVLGVNKTLTEFEV